MSANEKIFCPSCRIELSENDQYETSNTEIILNKFAGKVQIDFAFTYLNFIKGGIVQKLIHEIKYKGGKEIAREVGYWYGSQLKTANNFINEVDLIVGIPLHQSRLTQRGYNQADWIATGIGEALSIPVRTDIISRNYFKDSQTNKSRVERWKNVETVFSITDATAVHNKRIVLVDDVLTTGATIEACASKLLEAGCRSVGVLTLALTK